MTNKGETFIGDIIKVYRKHGLTLGHEDGQGAFLIEPYDEYNIDWLKQTLLRSHQCYLEEDDDQTNR